MNNLVKLVDGRAVLDPTTEDLIAQFEIRIKDFKKREDELKAAILADMEANNIISVETPLLKILYIAATDRETFDQKSFKEDFPGLYDEYIKMTKVKPSLRITVRNER